jgi:GDP-L-fucose synthase
MKVGITGGGGFIGRNLVAGLGHEVSAPGRQDLDLTDPIAVRRWLDQGQFDCVIHAATHNATAIACPEPGAVLARNLQMFDAIAGCQGAYGRMIWFGSGAEFDRRHWRGDMAEDEFGVHLPVDEYGVSKYRMTEVTAGRSDLLNLRVFGCYGPHEDWRIRFISQACVRAMWGLPIRVRAHNSFDYLWVDDLVEVVRWFVEHDAEHRVYNVCSGEQVELSELARTVEHASGQRVGIEVLGQGRGVPYGGTNARLLSAMPGLRFTSHEEAIARLVAFYIERKHTIRLEDVLHLG